MLALYLSVSSSFRSFSRMSLFLLFFVWISWLRGPRPCCVLQCLFCYDFLQALERWTVHRPSLTTNYDGILFNGRHWIRLDGRIKQRKLCKRAKWLTLISSCFVFSLLTAVGHWKKRELNHKCFLKFILGSNERRRKSKQKKQRIKKQKQKGNSVEQIK